MFLLGIILFFAISLAYSYQSDDAIIYQSVPNPSLYFQLEETVYFVIYNNGTEPIYISNLTHDWGTNFVKSIVSSYLGNDKVGYLDITSNTTSVNHYGDYYVNVNLTSPVKIEPKSYIEWYYTFEKEEPMMEYNITTTSNITVMFNDSSSKNREYSVMVFPSPVIQTDFKIDNLNYTTAEGADKNIFASTAYNFSFRVSDYANLIEYNYVGYSNVTLYEGNITIRFPDGFSDVTPISNNTACVNNICNCSVNFGLNTPPQICIIQATPLKGDYIIYANASKNEVLPFSVFPMKSVSELFIKAMPPPPQIVDANIVPSEINFGDYVTITAHVLNSDNVWATIDGHSISLSLVSGTYSNGIFRSKYYPAKEGTFSVIVHAKNEGGTSSYNAGTFHVNPPIAPPSPEACNNISLLGISRIPGVIDENKLLSLLDLSYYCSKNILGLWNYNFILEVTYLNGTYVKLNNINMVYGLAPGRTSSDILYGIPGGNIVSPRFGGGAQGGNIGVRSVPSPEVQWILPNNEEYKKVIYFDRFVILEKDNTYQLVRVSLGVWT